MTDRDLSPEELLATFPEEWILRADTYQLELLDNAPYIAGQRHDLDEFVSHPLPQPENDQEKQFIQMAKERAGEYNGTIELLLEEDLVLKALYQASVHIRQGYTEAVRARRIVAAYKLFSTAKDHTIAS